MTGISARLTAVAASSALAVGLLAAPGVAGADEGVDVTPTPVPSPEVSETQESADETAPSTPPAEPTSSSSPEAPPEATAGPDPSPATGSTLESQNELPATWVKLSVLADGSGLRANVGPDSAEHNFRVSLYEVTGDGLRRVAETRTSGEREVARFTGIPSGTYQVRVTREGYQPSWSREVAYAAPQLAAAQVRLLVRGSSPELLVANVDPNLADGSFDVVLFRKTQDGKQVVARDTTRGRAEVALFPGLPTGRYRALVKADHGLDRAWSAWFNYTRPEIQPTSVTVKADSDAGRIVADVSPNVIDTDFVVVLKRRTPSGYARVAAKRTSGAEEAAVFDDVRPGRYRAIVRPREGFARSGSTSVRVRPSSDGKRDAVVAVALAEAADRSSYYRLGGTGPTAYDCSGLMLYSYAKGAGITLPRTAQQQWAWSNTKRVSTPKKGDLVFFFGLGATHVGMYIGNGKMVHAANSRTDLEVTDVKGPWYRERFSGYGRIID